MSIQAKLEQQILSAIKSGKVKEPTLIAVNHTDLDKLIDEIPIIGPYSVHSRNPYKAKSWKTVFYRGIRVIRSMDLEEGEILVY